MARLAATVAGWTAISIGGLVLIGWALNIGTLQRLNRPERGDARSAGVMNAVWQEIPCWCGP